jgi:hypothetical protein
MLKKFYIGAAHIGAAIGRGDNASIQRATVEEAVEDAKQKIRDERGTDCVVVVEIVRVVRRDYPPISVEEV